MIASLSPPQIGAPGFPLHHPVSGYTHPLSPQSAASASGAHSTGNKRPRSPRVRALVFNAGIHGSGGTEDVRGPSASGGTTDDSAALPVGKALRSPTSRTPRQAVAERLVRDAESYPNVVQDSAQGLPPRRNSNRRLFFGQGSDSAWELGGDSTDGSTQLRPVASSAGAGRDHCDRAAPHSVADLGDSIDTLDAECQHAGHDHDVEMAATLNGGWAGEPRGGSASSEDLAAAAAPSTGPGGGPFTVFDRASESFLSLRAVSRPESEATAVAVAWASTTAVAASGHLDDSMLRVLADATVALQDEPVASSAASDP